MKIGFLGIGACGSNICEIAELYNYRTCIINTSSEDLETIQLVKNKLLIGKNGGTGKDRALAKADVKEYYIKIVNYVKEKFSESEIDMIYVVFSTGGGTGSGMAPIVTELLTKMIPEKKFGIITVLPSDRETAVAHINSLECLKEISKLNLPTFIVDNNRVLTDHSDYSIKQLYDKINNYIIDNFNYVVNTKRNPSKYGNIDSQDIVKLLSTPGISVISTLKINTEDFKNFNKKIMKSWDKSYYAPLEYDGVIKRMGFIYEVADSSTKGLSYEEIEREIGRPLEIFEGFYKPVEKDQLVISILTGLSFPEKRMTDINNFISEHKNDFGKNSEYKVLADVEWFNNLRNNSQINKKEKIDIDPSEITDIFGKY